MAQRNNNFVCKAILSKRLGLRRNLGLREEEELKYGVTRK